VSGELRLSRDFIEGPRAHRLHVAVRGRNQKRSYGGTAAVEFGPDFIGDPNEYAKPAFVFAPQSRDRVRQWSGGVAYEGRWSGVGELALSVQRVNYRKSSAIPGRVTPDSRDRPWLYSGAIAVHLTKDVAGYASFTRGLEESAAAPDVAINRDEAPPALLTRQVDAGLRWAITPEIRLIGGVFDVRKPYFSVDTANVYRRLGDVRHRGVELSLTGTLSPALQVVAGAVLLDAEVTGDARTLGLVGKRPFASTNRTMLLSGEYKVPRVDGLSLDASLNSYGRRVANTSNSLSLPATTTVDAGLRYRWRLAGRPVVLRVQASNLFNKYDWDLLSSNAFYFAAQRAVTARLSTDL
jgi:iron complex outermembrane receptor protein